MKKFCLFLAFFFCSLQGVQSQDCDCDIKQVVNNTVESCNFTLGTEVVVGNVTELWDAFNMANSTGGNMTILIEDGVYPVASTSSYPYLTASNLVIRSLSGNRDAVILTGQGMQSVEPLTEIVLSLQGDNVTIADLTIRDVGNHGISMATDNHFIYNVKIQDTFEQMIKGTTSGDGADNCIVRCCFFEYTAGIGPQWYIGGLDIHEGDNWVVSDNVFFNIASPSVSLAEHAVHFWDFSGNNIVERNTIVNCDRGIGFGLGSSPNAGGIIRNNMIYNDGTHLYDDVGIGLETSPNTVVYHNSIHIDYPNAIEYRFIESSNIEIANNLTNQNIQARNGGTANLNNNYTSGEYSWYNNPLIGDMRLHSIRDELLDAGMDLTGVVLDDAIRNVRPIGEGFDIGAQEMMIADVSLVEDGINLFPNPVSDQFNIVGLTSEYDIEVIDLMGNIFQTYNVSTDVSIDLTSLTNGIYFIRLKNKLNNKISLEKILVD